MRCGTGKEINCNMESMITKEVVVRMKELVDSAVADGAIIKLGGKKPENKDKGILFPSNYINKCKSQNEGF